MENQRSDAGQKSLSLVDMASAFVILGLGISLSILVFLIELIYKRIKTHYDTVIRPVVPVIPPVARKNEKTIPRRRRPFVAKIVAATRKKQLPKMKANAAVTAAGNNLPEKKVDFDEIKMG